MEYQTVYGRFWRLFADKWVCDNQEILHCNRQENIRVTALFNTQYNILGKKKPKDHG